MSYSIRNPCILILFKCGCDFKDPGFRGLLSLVFSPLIKADLRSSLSPADQHLKATDSLVCDCNHQCVITVEFPKAGNSVDANNPSLIFPSWLGTSVH